MRLDEVLNKPDDSKKPPAKLEANEHLTKLAEEVIDAVDVEREAKARAACAKEALMSAMDTCGSEAIEALGRTLRIKTSSSPDLTLKSLKGILGQDEAEKLWEKIPRKNYRSLDVPKSAEGDPI